MRFKSLLGLLLTGISMVLMFVATILSFILGNRRDFKYINVIAHVFASLTCEPGAIHLLHFSDKHSPYNTKSGLGKLADFLGWWSDTLCSIHP